MKRDHENTKAYGSPKGGMPMHEYESHLREYGVSKAHHMESFGGGMQPKNGNKGREGRYKRLERREYE